MSIRCSHCDHPAPRDVGIGSRCPVLRLGSGFCPGRYVEKDQPVTAPTARAEGRRCAGCGATDTDLVDVRMIADPSEVFPMCVDDFGCRDRRRARASRAEPTGDCETDCVEGCRGACGVIPALRATPEADA